MKNQSEKLMVKSQKLNSKFRSYYLLLLFIGLFTLLIGLRRSLIFQKKDRLNVVFYGEKTAFYSFGFDDGVDYFIGFPSDLRVPVPGGFGYYRLGGLGKLVNLEKKPDLYKKSFSVITSSFIDLYFYPKKDSVFFGKDKVSVFLPKFRQLFFENSNAGFFDRAYIFFLFSTKKRSGFFQETQIPVKNEAENLILDERMFSEQLIGSFYQTTYRNEKKNVQIAYTIREKNGLSIAKIIEGQGIRAVDINYNKNAHCRIVETETANSKTAKSLSNFFNCPVIKGKTEPYDIILELGEREKEWEVE